MSTHTLYCFWNKEYVNKWNINDINDIENTTIKMGNDLIIKLLRQKLSLKKIKIMFIKYLDTITNRKINKQPIYRTDHILFAQTIFALIKLKEYNDEDAYIILKNKKKKKNIKCYNTI